MVYHTQCNQRYYIMAGIVLLMITYKTLNKSSIKIMTDIFDSLQFGINHTSQSDYSENNY